MRPAACVCQPLVFALTHCLMGIPLRGDSLATARAAVLLAPLFAAAGFALAFEVGAFALAGLGLAAVARAGFAGLAFAGAFAAAFFADCALFLVRYEVAMAATIAERARCTRGNP